MVPLHQLKPLLERLIHICRVAGKGGQAVR
jgi:hypothetical protein